MYVCVKGDTFLWPSIRLTIENQNKCSLNLVIISRCNKHCVVASIGKKCHYAYCGEAMLGLVGMEGLYLHYFLDAAKWHWLVVSHIWKAVRVTVRLRIVISSIGFNCLLACQPQRILVEIKAYNSKKLKKECPGSHKSYYRQMHLSLSLSLSCLWPYVYFKLRLSYFTHLNIVSNFVITLSLVITKTSNKYTHYKLCVQKRDITTIWTRFHWYRWMGQVSKDRAGKYIRCPRV